MGNRREEKVSKMDEGAASNDDGGNMRLLGWGVQGTEMRNVGRRARCEHGNMGTVHGGRNEWFACSNSLSLRVNLRGRPAFERCSRRSSPLQTHTHAQIKRENGIHSVSLPLSPRPVFVGTRVCVCARDPKRCKRGAPLPPPHHCHLIKDKHDFPSVQRLVRLTFHWEAQKTTTNEVTVRGEHNASVPFPFPSVDPHGDRHHGHIIHVQGACTHRPAHAHTQT